MTITNKIRSSIFKAAWTIARKDGRAFGDALRRAWAWMRRKMASTTTAPRPQVTPAPVSTGNGQRWARPIPVFTATGNKVVWNIGRSYGRSSSGYGAWIGR